MDRKKRYVMNAETLAYEFQKISPLKLLSKGMVLFLLSLVLALIYYVIYTEVLGLDTPRTIALKQKASRIHSKMDIAKSLMSDSWMELEGLQARDNNVYRPIFGMEQIDAATRNSGFPMDSSLYAAYSVL